MQFSATANGQPRVPPSIGVGVTQVQLPFVQSQRVPKQVPDLASWHGTATYQQSVVGATMQLDRVIGIVAGHEAASLRLST